MTARLLFVAAMSAALCSFLSAQDLPRVGFEENFDSADGWQRAGGAPIKALVEKDGALRFETVCGALEATMKRPDWPEWPKSPNEPNTTMRKDYGVTLDFSVYHYVVVNLVERGTAVTLSIDGSPIPVCYTTGLRAFDLRNRGFEGKRPVRLGIELLNSSGVATFDTIRIVRELTDEEKKVLMPPPVDYADENRKAAPYHNLEALNARAGRPRRPECEGQLAVYRDTISNGEVWKLTDQPGDQAFRSGDTTRGWGRDGRYFSCTGGTGGKNVWDAAAARWRETLGSGGLSGKPVPKYAAQWESDVTPEIIYGYTLKFRRPEVDWIFTSFNRATGEEKEFARFTSTSKWDVREITRGEGDKVAIGLRGNFDVWIVDPLAKDPKEVVRYVKLPTRLKGLNLADHDRMLVWFNCYTYEQLTMDLATGKVGLGYYTSGGHAGGGGGWTLRHYEGMTTIQPEDMFDWRAGDKVKVFAYYKKPLDTDYGQLIDGGRWWLVNGTGADVKNQHLLVDGKDCATVLRLCGYNSSRNNWSTNTYSIASPDATKVAWASDQLGDGDVYYVVARKPDAPRNLHFEKTPTGVKLTWDAPERYKETAGYVVYGGGADLVFRPLVTELIAKTEWSGAVPAETTRFLVTAREWSGLEGLPSAMAPDGEPGRPNALHLNVWEAARSRTARVVFDGTAEGTRCVRYFKASADEKDKPRVRWEGITGRPDGKPYIYWHTKPDLDSRWSWTTPDVVGGCIVGDDVVEVPIPEDALVDEIVVANQWYRPKMRDDRFPPPAAIAGAKATVAADGLVTLTWDKPKDLDFSHVEIFTGADEKLTCENRTALGAVLAAQEQKFLDWGLKPGSKVLYKLVAVSGQDVRSEPVVVSAEIPGNAQTVCVEVSLDKAKATGKFDTVEVLGEKVMRPWPTKETDKPDPAEFLPLAFPFDVPVDGTYSIWVRYSPGWTPRLGIPVSIDGAAPADWEVRPPYRPMSTMYGRGRGAEKVWTDRLIAGTADTFSLKAGAHELVFRLDPTQPDGQTHGIARIWVTNDPSWRPEGFDPRADFRK